MVRSLPASSLKAVIVSLHQFIYYANAGIQLKELLELPPPSLIPWYPCRQQTYTGSQPTFCLLPATLSRTHIAHIFLHHLSRSSLLCPGMNSPFVNVMTRVTLWVWNGTKALFSGIMIFLFSVKVPYTEHCPWPLSWLHFISGWQVTCTIHHKQYLLFLCHFQLWDNVSWEAWTAVFQHKSLQFMVRNWKLFVFYPSSLSSSQIFWSFTTHW